MANKQNRELFNLIDELLEHGEQIQYYATGRTRSGSRVANRLNNIENHASKIEDVAKEIQNQIQKMRKV